jgi:MinD superfamily P-loop ATPase
MREVVVISGKGGTGKTSLTASFACIGGEAVVSADCDVDAANLHLLLKPKIAYEEVFLSGESAEIDPAACTGCGLCADVCEFSAVFPSSDASVMIIDEGRCEGCGYCFRVCPVAAITMKPALSGTWFRSAAKTGGIMIHAELAPGADNSGKLVAKVKNEARNEAGEHAKEIVLVDGPPGIGCPVISSLSGADYVVLVTEPTKSALHDLKRVHELVSMFSIRAGCVVNKYDLNPTVYDEILAFLDEKNIELLGTLPYDNIFTEAMTAGLTAFEFAAGVIREKLVHMWDSVVRQLEKEE